MTDAAHRCRILLEQLYHLSQRSRLDEHFLFPEQVSAILHVGLDDTIDIVNFLEELGYIKCGRSFGTPYSWIRLTSKGLQLFMNPSEFEQAFQQITSNVSLLETMSVKDQEDDSTEDASFEPPSGGVHVLSNVPPDTPADIKESLHYVIDRLAQNDDEPLRELLGNLILEGGLERTLAGVKGLLAVVGCGRR
ncbi:hypothetical protein [Alicyclobacillus ferrooxydans]|uniref:Uncharacterized protein n=1 Tax=Alicyclobacillus ferrooxydans TaxID=471514 RepID=A0A0P9EL48_9BACL|nr:hypothetical protein [Alicyclobacillus ferrooxydans]KPV43945.1 hypothetical protein AN477_09480 [Alicyclobacillus ferrooxydans]